MGEYQNLAVIILAAGKGTRMKSDKAKVLHPVAGKSMVCHVVQCAVKLAADNVHVVVGHQADTVKEEVSRNYTVQYSLQKKLLGTGDAVKTAIPEISEDIAHVLVLCGDVPLVKEKSLERLFLEHIQKNADVSVLATRVDHPTGYGRILLDELGQVKAIREEADASASEKLIQLVNTGIYCFDKDFLSQALQELTPDNNQNEYYLTDVIAIAKKKERKVCVVTIADSNQVVGVNTLEDLRDAEFLFASQSG